MFITTCSASWTHNYATFAEKFFVGTTMALLGISIVFIVLVLISLFVQLLSVLISKSTGKTKTSEQVAPAPEAQLPESSQPAAADDQQVIAAVIAAAIAAATEQAAPASSAGFTIRRIRRV